MLALGLAGCGPEPVDVTHTSTLDDGDAKLRVDQSPYERYEVELGTGWRVVADMHGATFDPYLHLIDPDNRQVVQTDDARPGTHDAHLEHTASAAGTYLVIANAARPDGRGEYTLHIVTTAPP